MSRAQQMQVQRPAAATELQPFDPLEAELAMAEEIVQLERGVQELNELFVDMLDIVRDQGKVIDNIEENVEKALHRSDQAVVELRKADQNYSPGCTIA